MALLSGAGTFHRLAEKKEVTDIDGFESHTLAPLPFMEQPSHSAVFQRERTCGDLRGSHAHLGLGLSSCFWDPDHINLSLLHRNEENVAEVYSQFTVYVFRFHLLIPHHTKYSNFYAEKTLI